MKLLLNDRNIIIAINNEIEYGVWGNLDSLPSWKIGKTSYLIDENYSLIEMEESLIPLYVCPNRYCFIDNSFQLVSNPNQDIENIKNLLNQNLPLEEQIPVLKTALYQILDLLAK